MPLSKDYKTSCDWLLVKGDQTQTTEVCQFGRSPLIARVIAIAEKEEGEREQTKLRGTPMEKPGRFSSKLLNGAIAGSVGVTCIFPLDLCKTRLQEQVGLGGQKLYKNFWDCVKKVSRAEGLSGLYKGLGVNVLLVNPEKALKLAVNDQLRQILGGRRKILPIYQEMVAGGAAGFCQVIVTTPMEMLKIQLQIAGKPVVQTVATPGTATASMNLRAYGTSAESRRSALYITRDLLRTKGISGIYKGLGATLLRDVPFSCIYFPLFAFLNLKGMNENDEKPNMLKCLLAGCAAGLVASFSVNPCDVIKTRLQVIRRGNAEPVYMGIIDCARQTLRNEGIAAFYKGAVPRMMVIAPLFGIAQVVYFVGVAEIILGVERQ